MVPLSILDLAAVGREEAIAESVEGGARPSAAQVRTPREAWVGPICIDEDDVEARSILAFSLFIGSNFIVVEHQGRSRLQVLGLAIDRLLAESWS